MPETSQPLSFGDYVVDRELGRGGMGVVYAATHRELGKRVAVKVLLAEVSRDAELIERFRNEARAASAIEHPSIVEIHTVGTEGDTVYIVMELLQGESLSSRLKVNGAMTIAEAIGLARQCANALDAAHRVGIVHRDLKPDNVFLMPDEEVAGGHRVKLLDFGIAKLVGDSTTASVARTVTGAILGTPHYMSPEQCEGAREIDARSDLYSLGCMLFQMVTGRLPFMSAGIGGLIGMHLHVAPPTLRSIRPDVPSELDELVGKLLAKAPEDRIQTAAEVSAALRDLSGRPSKPTLPPPQLPIAPVNMATMATVVAETEKRPPTRSRKPNKTWIALGAGVAIAAGVVGFIATRGEDEPPPAPPAAKWKMNTASDAPVASSSTGEVTRAPRDQAPAPAPPPVAAPTKRLELVVGEKRLQEGDIDDAERQLVRLRREAPTDPAVLAFAEAVGTARARQLIPSMKKNAAAKRYVEVKRDRDRISTLTKDRVLRANADEVWSGIKAEAVAAVLAKVTAIVKVGKPDCDAAHREAKLGEQLGERYDALFAECKLRVKKAADEEGILRGIRDRIRTSQFPQTVTMECNNLIRKDYESVPWGTCIDAACRWDVHQAESMIVNAPADVRNKYARGTCPEK